MSDSTREFEFTLLCEHVDAIETDLENALFEAGCDDATISLEYGRVVLTFCRSALSMKNAIISAIQDVRRAGIEELRVDECDLVSQADIGRLIGRSRQLVHQYITGIRGPGAFPPPVCHITDGAPLWYWCEVAQWLYDHDLILKQTVDDAQEKAVINNVLELNYYRHIQPDLIAEVTTALGQLADT